MRINKIIYFLHVYFIEKFGRPLVTAKIEAWDHGPVFREIYHQFKRFGRGMITDLARRFDVTSGSYHPVEVQMDDDEYTFLRERCEELLQVPAGVLVDLSHVEGGPWHSARFGKGQVNPGVEITLELILDDIARGVRH